MDKVISEFCKKPVLGLVLGGIASLILALSLGRTQNSSEAQPTAETPTAIDTFIPAGMVLVPIEVHNYESLDSVLGSYGVVDLFATDENGRRDRRPLVKRVKILRAPKNPSQFAVLIPDAQASQLVKTATPFFVVVQNPTAIGTRFERVQPQKTRIVYEGN